MPTRKVRVLFLNDTARNGGPGRSLYYILRFLDPARIHRAVVLPRAGVISELLTRGGTRVVEELHFAGNLVENPFEPWSRAMVRADFEAAPMTKAVRLAGNVVRGGLAVAQIAGLVRRGAIDLLYCNGTNADFAGGAVAGMTGVPALWHVRYSSLPAAVRGVHDRLAASRGVARILCVSRASAALFPHVPGKVRVLHNALDVDEFRPGAVAPILREELGIGADTIVFGSQGRILRRKGYVEMIRAARVALSAMTADEKARTAFVVIGDTPEDLRPDHLAECRALVRELGLEARVHLLGFRRDVKPYVAAFDVAVVPSVYPDPLPRSVLEAMAFAKPVVAFDVGGVGEMVEDGETGTLVPGGEPADVDGLAFAMLRYARDPRLRARHGQLGRERVVRDFDGRAQAREIQGEIVRASGVSP